MMEAAAAARMMTFLLVILAVVMMVSALPSQNAGHGFDLDPAGDPVLRRLDVPAAKVNNPNNMSKRMRRQTDDGDLLPEGSGSDVDGFDDSDNYDESEDSSEVVVEPTHVTPSHRSPTFDMPSITPVLKQSKPSTTILPSKTKAAVKPTTLISASEATDGQIEPTPVVIRSGMSSSVFRDDYTNGTFLLEPVEPTASSGQATPPLPDDLAGLVGPNLIGLDEDEPEEKSGPVPPTVTRTLQKMTATAGKVFRFPIPAETFSDVEDGSTRRLKLDLVGEQLAEMSWIAFNASTQEIYGLPLAEDIGKYAFLLRARNSANLTVTEPAEIHVRQHPAERTFHHRFTLQLEPEFTDDEANLPPAFWMLKTVAAINKVTGGDVREDSVVIRSVNGSLRNNDAFTVMWSNDSLDRTECPRQAIDDILEQLYNVEADEVTAQLDQELAPQLSVTNGGVELDGICKPLPTSAPAPTAKTDVGGPKVNRPPTVRNAVDHIDAVVGVLFRFMVPADAFYDEEDGPTRMLKLTLNNVTNQPVHPRSWLQFDVYNQEFYGLPMDSDAGLEEYILVATDSGGLSASDGLVVSIRDRSKMAELNPLVEFSLRIETDFDSLTGSAQRKVRLVESIATLFGDSDPRNVVIHSFQPGSTVVTWSNATLVSGSDDGESAKCPDEEIEALRKILMDDDGKLTQKAMDVLTAADFEPVSARMTPLGRCLGQLTPTYGPASEDDLAGPGGGGGAAVEEGGGKASGDATWSDDYLLTFIVPGIIITVMLLLAAVIACILYRRRRTGKLGLEERRSFVSKGIPIIFAEELEERPTGRHPAKAPVILKEEKPSQPPPEYHKVPRSSVASSSAAPAGTTGTYRSTAEQQDLLRSPDGPTLDEDEDEPAGLYQPPPPLSASSSRYARPKATPAYRKPPPYVPP